MKTIKTCPQCGNDFQGRNNKVYCSDKCKMATFKQSQEENPMEEDDELFVSTKQIPEPKRERTPIRDKSHEHELELQVQLRKLELEHLRTLAAIEAEEKEKVRNFELSKMKLSFEQLRQHQIPEILPSEEMEEEYEKEEETIIILPKDLMKEYKDLVKLFLKAEGTNFKLAKIQRMKEDITQLARKLVAFAQKNGVHKNELTEFIHLKDIALLLDELIEEINGFDLWDEKVTNFEVEEDWREELLASLS